MNSTHLSDEPLCLKVNRRFKAPRERVFNAFASYEMMKHWFGPPNCAVQSGQVDFRCGGRYRLEVSTESMGTVAVSGEYREIVRPEKIAFSWKWEGHPEVSNSEMEVVIEFVEVGETETDLRLTQTGFPDREVAESHGEGWNGTFDKLGPLVAVT